MKKFIIKLTLFAIIFVSISYLVDYIISTGLKRTEEYRFQSWNDIIESKINADILIVGNSRAFSHYSPQILDSILKVNSYNIGIGGHPFNVQHLKYELYERHNTKPKLIIQNIDFFTFSNHVSILHEREQVFPYINDSFLKDKLINFGFSGAELYLPFYRYFGHQMVIKNGVYEYFGLKHYNSQPAYKGYRPEQGKWDGTELNKLSKIQPLMDETTISLFENYLKHCKKFNIKVVMVNTPIYYAVNQKLENKNKFNDLIVGISKKYNIPYLDYTNDPICFDTVNFRIAVHLNKKGAEMFSKKLANDLKAMNLLKQKTYK
jgi:hypothetical protein